MASFAVTSYLNPAQCAKVFLRALGQRIDEASFNDVANQLEATGFVCAGEGFFVESIDDLQRLCELGNFTVVARHDGVLEAVAGPSRSAAYMIASAPRSLTDPDY